MNREHFLAVKNQFFLGNLATEGFHPLSLELSQNCIHNPANAIQIFAQIDHMALNCLRDALEDVASLAEDIHATFKSGKKVFLVGCGATGRLSLALETIYKKKYPNSLVGLMAGGDFALIKSVESFEDEQSYAVRQLEDVGYSPGDLVIGITEGGETSFVIGAVIHAAQNNGPRPWLFYCNRDQELENLDRCRAYLNNSNIEKLSVPIGPMALSGSTRLQASTVQMLGMGFALGFGDVSRVEFLTRAELFIEQLLKLDYSQLEPFIIEESKIYEQGDHINYLCDPLHAISVLTDTTERSPTFNEPAFETIEEAYLSKSYLAIKGTHSSEEAWKSMLGRAPRSLEWKELAGKVSLDKIYKFDISENAIRRRSQRAGCKQFEIKIHAGVIAFQLGELHARFPLEARSLLGEHVGLKLLLNCHSTLVMGRLGKIHGNVMTWVRPSNYKLVDRATRYAQEILKHKGVLVPYDKVAEKIFEFASIKEESIVLKVVSEFS